MADPEGTRYRTEVGKNYKDGSYNYNGSHMVGWDNKKVRAEVYKFTAGAWPIKKITWWGPQTVKADGSYIPIRYAISTSETTYVNSHGSGTGTELTQNAYNTLNVDWAPGSVHYFTFFPGTNVSSGTWYGLYTIGESGNSNWFSVWSVEEKYTNCTAPTTLSLNKNIQIPGGSATLSWSGATAGTNLSITGYEVYYSNAANGTYSYLGTTTGTSYPVTAPTTRESSYYYKVLTKANIADYNSDLSSASSGLKANKLPNSPSASVNRSVVPSFGGSVTFTVSPGSDSDGQTCTLAYSIGSSTTKTSFTSPLTVDITGEQGDSTTYYFYTYDGLEYSNSATSQTVTVNTKPQLTNPTYDSITTYSALNGNGTEGYQLGYANIITPKVTTSKTGTLTVDLEYYNSANNETTTWDSSGTINYALLQEKTVSPAGTITLNSANIHQFITLGATNIHWRLRFRFNDGIEDSDSVYYPSSSSGESYAIARAPSLGAAYNQFNNSNISGTIPGEIWRNVRLVVYNDTSVPLTNVTAISDGSTISVSNLTTSTDSTNRYIDITLPDGITSGAVISITAQMTDSNGYISKSVSATVTETKAPTLGSMSHGADTIHPFIDTGTFEISFGWPFGSYTSLETALPAYNCGTSGAIKLVHSSSNVGDGANQVTKSTTWAKESDTLGTTMNKATIYTFTSPHELGYTTYNGSRTYYCRIEIENLFGKTFATSWLARKFDFRELAVAPTITSIQYADSETPQEWTTLGANDKIQEGMYLKFNCSFKLYTTDALTVYIERKKGSEKLDLVTQQYTAQELYRASSRDIEHTDANELSYIYHVTTEIADTTNRSWCLKIKNTGGTIRSSYVTTKVLRHTAPDLILSSCVVNADYETNHLLDFAFTMSDNGGGTLTNYLYDGENTITNALSGTTSGTITSGSVEVLSDYRTWEVKTISIKTVSTVSGLISTNPKIFYSNAIIVYQLAPTIAYRQNQLGINTKNPDSNATVDIHQATGKSLVLIQGVDASTNPPTPTKFEIDVSTGQIKYYINNTLQNVIDLSNGILT